MVSVDHRVFDMVPAVRRLPHGVGEHEDRAADKDARDGMTMRVGRSPAYPQMIHAVKKERELMGGCVARWQCERGRGEVYGAITVAGSWDDVNCPACRAAGGVG